MYKTYTDIYKLTLCHQAIISNGIKHVPKTLMSVKTKDV